MARHSAASRDGDVYSTDYNTAVKFLANPESYARERDVYMTLKRLGIEEICSHFVPILVRADDAFLAIEMTVVPPPFLLDFVSAYPESKAPEFPPEVWEDWYAEEAEQFGSNWPKV